MDKFKSRIHGMLELIGSTLGRKREARGVTQKAIADEAGIALAGYQQMETGKRNYRIVTFLRVLHVFNLDIMRALETSQPIRGNPKHQVLHEKLNDLLQAPEPWPTVAEYNVEAVWLKWKAQKSKS